MSGVDGERNGWSAPWVTALLIFGWVMLLAIVVFAFFWPMDWWPP
jgi:hypothetical protein